VAGTTLIACIACPIAPRALAYIQYQVVDKTTGKPTGVRIHWNRNCIDVVAYPADIIEMTADQVEQAAGAAAASWSQSTLSCTYLNVQLSASFDATRPAGSDAYNVLVFRDPWCDPANPADCQPEALAITSVFAGRNSGVIQDADIEVNTENFVWGDLAAQPAAGKQDLQNALTHEMGHLIGLDHDCYTPGVDSYRQTDNTGALAPFCLGASQAIQEATMFTKADFGDLTKRTLAPDDENGVCGIYPAAQDPHYCPPPGTIPVVSTNDPGCGCRVDRPTDSIPSLALTALLVGAAAARTRRKRR
jgi:MYXO-CTERM domain-containing protein